MSANRPVGLKTGHRAADQYHAGHRIPCAVAETLPFLPAPEMHHLFGNSQSTGLYYG